MYFPLFSTLFSSPLVMHFLVIIFQLTVNAKWLLLRFNYLAIYLICSGAHTNYSDWERIRHLLARCISFVMESSGAKGWTINIQQYQNWKNRPSCPSATDVYSLNAVNKNLFGDEEGPKAEAPEWGAEARNTNGSGEDAPSSVWGPGKIIVILHANTCSFASFGWKWGRKDTLVSVF